MLTRVCAYFLAQTFVREQVEVEEVGEEGEKIDIEEVDLSLIGQVCKRGAVRD